jgi:hypothetical protein
MEKAIIFIDLKKHLEDFLIHDFGTDESGAIRINRRCEMGKYIDSMWESSPTPVQLPGMDNPVRLRLPTNSYNWYKKTHRFIFFSEEKTDEINSRMEEFFLERLNDFFAEGYGKKFKQKDIVNAFVEAYGSKNQSINFDQIKKLEYRNRKKRLKSLVLEIQKALIQ